MKLLKNIKHLLEDIVYYIFYPISRIAILRNSRKGYIIKTKKYNNTIYARDLPSQVERNISTLGFVSNVNQNETNYLFYGPYLNLPQGKYLVALYYDASKDCNATFDIATDGGANILKLKKIKYNKEKITTKLNLNTNTIIETRLKCNGKGRITVSKIKIIGRIKDQNIIMNNIIQNNIVENNDKFEKQLKELEHYKIFKERENCSYFNENDNKE